MSETIVKRQLTNPEWSDKQNERFESLLNSGYSAEEARRMAGIIEDGEANDSTALGQTPQIAAAQNRDVLPGLRYLRVPSESGRIHESAEERAARIAAIEQARRELDLPPAA